MIKNKDVYKGFKRVIELQLESADNAASAVSVLVDAAASTTGSTPFKSIIEVVSSAGAQKTGWSKSYITSGVSAGYLTISKGTLTFATGDVITIIGTLLP